MSILADPLMLNARAEALGDRKPREERMECRALMICRVEVAVAAMFLFTESACSIEESITQVRMKIGG